MRFYGLDLLTQCKEMLNTWACIWFGPQNIEKYDAHALPAEGVNLGTTRKPKRKPQ
jgi:hypothetical protein